MDNKGLNSSEFILALSFAKNWGNKKIADFIMQHGFDLQECLNFLELVLDSYNYSHFDEYVSNARYTLNKNKEKKIQFITMFDKEFPSKLYKNDDPVIYLYYCGDVNLLNSKCITIIGTRKLSPAFLRQGYDASYYFAKKGYSVVSGLALGSDAIAHKACLDADGKTIAVLPTALDKVSPRTNRDLARNIYQKGGLLISEYSVTELTQKFFFAKRDRIQSYLSNVDIVIQSTDTGGTMNAVRKSLEQGKKVYALKGNKISIIESYIDVEDYEQLGKIETEL